MQIARNLPFPGYIFFHLCFLPSQTWPFDIVADSGRHTYAKISFHQELGKKYGSILIDHHLKNLLVLATSSVNPNIEVLVNGKDIQRIRIKLGVFHVNASQIRHF